MVKSYTDSDIITRMQSLPSYKGMPEGYHLVVIRSDEDEFNVFDDKVYLYNGGKFILVASCTSNPGGPALLGGWKKHNKRGAAVIKADEIYYDGLSYGLHNGKMPALRQVKPFKYSSDWNNNKKVDEDGPVETSIRNTNFHFNSYKVFQKIKLAVSRIIGEWSYGCVVCNEQAKYEEIITRTKPQKFVTLTVLKEF